MLQEHQGRQDYLDPRGYRVNLDLQELLVQMEQMDHLVLEVMLDHQATKGLRALRDLKGQEDYQE